MEKILITGGAGNIGSSLAGKLLADGDYFVVIVDDLSTGSIDKLPAKKSASWQFIKADVNDFSSISTIMITHQFDYVFHLAAVVGVTRTLQTPINVLKDIEGIKNILELSKNTGVKRVFYSSSSEVYGEPVEFPQNEETTPLNSRLPYAIVKNVGEAFFKSYYNEFGLEYNIFRYFNTYGPFQSTDFVVPKFIDAALGNEDITIYGDGLQTRTFCYIDDNTDACVAILKDPKWSNQVINIGNDLETSILDLAKLIIDKTGSASKIRHLSPLAEGDMTRRKPDITKLKEILKRPLITLEEGIQKTIDFKTNTGGCH